MSRANVFWICVAAAALSSADRCLACDPADMNCDGAVNGRDIMPFVTKLLGDASPGYSACAGDMNASGGVTVSDMAPFVASLLDVRFAQVADGCLLILGTNDAAPLALRLHFGFPSAVDVDFGNDGAPEFSFDRGQFTRIQIDARGGDDLVLIDQVNGIFTDTEITTIDGGAGADTLLGGSGGETFIGGGGNDTISGGNGDDRFIWNPGDGSDIIDGSAGLDTVEINGDNVAESFTVTASGTRVRFDRLSPTPFFLDIGTCESLVLNANGGNDSLNCTGNLASLIQITADGGPGDDTLLGSNGADVLIGGDNNDFIDGQQGNDTILLGNGDDTFQWDPGDGNDVVEGQAGHDVILFNGSNANEVYDFSPNGSRLRVTRNVGAVTLDANGVEQFDLRPLGGIDSVTVNNLAGTSVTQVNIDLASTIGGSAGDAAQDDVIIAGSPGFDVFNVFPDGDFVLVDLAADVRVRGREANDQVVFNGVGGDVVNVNGSSGPDTITVTANGTQARVDATGYSAGVAVSGALSLAVNALAGNDMVSCTGNLAAIVPITIDGGPGDDTLLGSNGADVLIGGDNNDFIDGQQGNDTILLGNGDDTFQWDPGDGNDVVEGQAGHDVILFNGSNANEVYDFSPNGSRLRVSRNVGAVTLDANGVEQFDLRTLGGVDSATVNSLAGTSITQINISLAGTIAGGTGDGSADALTVNGTNLNDTIHVDANGGAVEVSGLAAFVRITGSEAALDSLTVNGLLGTDTITAGPGVTALIMLFLNP